MDTKVASYEIRHDPPWSDICPYRVGAVIGTRDEAWDRLQWHIWQEHVVKPTKNVVNRIPIPADQAIFDASDDDDASCALVHHPMIPTFGNPARSSSAPASVVALLFKHSKAKNAIGRDNTLIPSHTETNSTSQRKVPRKLAKLNQPAGVDDDSASQVSPIVLMGLGAQWQ